MKQLNIPKELIPKLKELQEENSDSITYKFLKKHNIIQMFTTLGIDLYLTFDGRVLVGDYFDEHALDLREAKNFAEVAMAIILGAEERKSPELLTLLPKRPENALDCESCENKSGWYNLPNIGKFICEHCGGLGWQFLENK